MTTFRRPLLWFFGRRLGGYPRPLVGAILLAAGLIASVSGSPQAAPSDSNPQEIFDRLVYTRELPGNHILPESSSRASLIRTDAAHPDALDVEFLRIDDGRTDRVDARDLKSGMAFRLRITTRAEGFLYILQDDPRSKAPVLVYPGEPSTEFVRMGRRIIPGSPSLFRVERESGPTTLFVVLSRSNIARYPVPRTARALLEAGERAGILGSRQARLGGE